MRDPDGAVFVEGLTIAFRPHAFAAFHDGQTSYWLNYAAVHAAGLTTLTGACTLSGHTIGDTPYIDVTVEFDPACFDTEKLGLIYGDRQFAASVNALVAGTLGLARTDLIDYTEQGMQGKAHVSMEMGHAGLAALRGMSRHLLLSLAHSPVLAKVCIPSWGLDIAPPDMRVPS